MLYGPDMYDSDDEDGLSDDCDYGDFKEKFKARKFVEVEETEEMKRERFLETVFSYVTNGKTEAFTQELDAGLDLNQPLQGDWTPLQLACTLGKYEIAKVLIERGADLKLSRDGSSLLMLACIANIENEAAAHNILNIVKLLIEKGLDAKEIDRKRTTALMLAASGGSLELVQYLLPLSDLEAKDNQKWSALFHAVDNKHKEIAKFLLEQGADFEISDVRNNTVLDVAKRNGFEEIIELFPVDEAIEKFFINLTIDLEFEENFDALRPAEKPQFLSDVCKLLHGCRCENTAPLFQNISLLEFLTLNDQKLQELGVVFPYQRRRILGGLYKFHKHVYLPKSVPYVPKEEMYTNANVASEVITCVKQVIAMEAALKFIRNNAQFAVNLDSDAICNEISRRITHVKAVAKNLRKKAEKWDSTLKPAVLIRKKRRNVPWCNVFTFGMVTITLIFLYKFNKK